MGKTKNFGLWLTGPLGFHSDTAQDGGNTWDCDANMQAVDAALATAGFTPPVTKTLYVDVNRQDSYTPDGSLLKPFKSITAALNQIVTNGDNTASVAYIIQIAPGTYAESILLNNPALVNLIFIGYGATVDASISGATGDGHDVAAINNDSLLSAVFIGLSFGNSSNLGHGADGHLFTFSSTTNGTNCLKGLNAVDVWGLQFLNCTFPNCGSADFFAQCVKGILIGRCHCTL